MRRSRLMTRVPSCLAPIGSYLDTGRSPSRVSPGLGQPVAPAGNFTRRIADHSPNRYVGQISPDKNVNFHDTTAAFTPLLEPWASYMSCRLTRKRALYAVSVSFGRLRTSLAHRFALRLPCARTRRTYTNGSSRPSAAEPRRLP